MQTIKINNRKELDALAANLPDVARMAERLAEYGCNDRFPLTVVFGSDATTINLPDPFEGIPLRTVTDLFKTPGDSLTGRAFDDGVYGVGLVSVPIDKNCKVLGVGGHGAPRFIVAPDADVVANQGPCKVKNHGPRGKWGKLK
jgi:hypothetical protein